MSAEGEGAAPGPPAAEAAPMEVASDAATASPAQAVAGGVSAAAASAAEAPAVDAPAAEVASDAAATASPAQAVAGVVSAAASSAAEAPAAEAPAAEAPAVDAPATEASASEEAAGAPPAPAPAPSPSPAAFSPPPREAPQRGAPGFVRRLLGDDADAIAHLCGSVLQGGDARDARQQLAASLAAEAPADAALNIGSDDAAKVVAHFCRHNEADTRTSRTMVDVLLLLQPAPELVDLWLCLAAIVRRFAPIALLPGAGHAIMNLCRLFESLLLFHDPEIALLLKRAGVGAEMYCVPWLCTAHATGLADLGMVLHVWDRWIDGGEHLDPVFLGLARLSLCRGELLLCGPVPELGQLLHTSLGRVDHAAEHVVDVALRRAAELKAMTPLSFLKRLQDALLRPAPEESDAPATGDSQGSLGDKEQRLPGVRAAQRLTSKATSWLGRRGVGLGVGAAPSGGAAASAPSSAPRPTGAGVQPIACMRVEAQDVMMLETVKERHLDRIRQMRAAAEADQQQDGEWAVVGASPEESGGGEEAQEAPASSDARPPPRAAATAAPSSGSDACRLVPRLVDLRSAGETTRYGIRGVKVIDVARPASVPEFVEWSRQKAADFLTYGLCPMHVLLTSEGVMSAEQQTFLRAVLTSHVPGLCILSGGYTALEPFFLSDPTSSGGAAETLAAGAQEAKELLSKGVVGLQTLWGKAPSRHALKERLGATLPPVVRGAGGTPTAPATFERAPMPPAWDTPPVGAPPEGAEAPEAA